MTALAADCWKSIAKDWSKAMAFDPLVSEKQSKAMFAAAEGKSTLGTPEKVGKEFVSANNAPRIASGVVHVAPTGRVLLLKRSNTEPNYGGHWSLPGGKGDAGETPVDAALRECREEIGSEPSNLEQIDEKTTPTGMTFHTFRSEVDDEFEPVLNDEHTEYGWFSPDERPSPIHPAVEGVLKRFDGAQDGALAFDRASLRSYDRDGRLHVEPVPISRANVCPYYGREIPGWEKLGLDPERIYQLLRDPEELEKGAPTFNGIQILMIHEPLNADDPKKELVVGSTGTDAEWQNPFLMNSLAIWEREAINGIESGEKKQLSSAYHYRPDMTLGTYEGQRYDGVMRDIEGNHVALVFEGRAGPSVVVGDSKENVSMKMPLLSRKAALMQGAALAFLSPKLAADSKINIAPLFAGVTTGNAKSKIPGIVSAIEKAVSGKLAADASPEGLAVLLNALSETESPLEAKDAEEEIPPALKPDTGEEAEPEVADPAAPGVEAEAGDPVAAVKAFLAGKLSDEDMIKLDELVSAIGEAGKQHEVAETQDVNEDEEPVVPGKQPDKEEKPDMGKMVTKTAMDEAIKAAVKSATDKATKVQREIRDAEAAVAPFVGKLIACDSAESVYRTALKALGYLEADTVHVSALPSVLALMKQPGDRPAYRETRLAADSASADDFSKMFPETARIVRA